MLSYFFLTNLSLCLLYAVYWLFLRRETFSRLNRFYLLGAGVLSLVIPAAEFPEIISESVNNQVVSVISVVPILQENKLETAVTTHAGVEKLETASGSVYWQWVSIFWKPMVWCLYWAGVAVFFIKFAKTSWNLYRIIAKHEKTKQGDYILINYSGTQGIFSFFNFLFWSSQIPPNELIMKHELAHIRQRHSFDILFFEMLAVVFWFNPVIALYQKSIRLIHEYLADEAVTGQISSKTDYAHTLLAYATQSSNVSLFAHYFSYPQISYPQTLKQRIMKIYQEKSNTKARLKYLLAVPVLLVCLLVAACEKQTFDVKENEESNTEAKLLAYIPADFQEKINAFKKEFPEKYIYFNVREAKFLQRDLDDANEGINWDKITYYRPISAEEDRKYMEGEFQEHENLLIKEHGKDSKQVVTHREMMKSQQWSNEPMVGFIYVSNYSLFAKDEFSFVEEDMTVYTSVDEFPAPRDGEAFYAEMLKLVKFENDIKAEDLAGDMVLEMIVTKTGQITKANIIESVTVKTVAKKQTVFPISIFKNTPSPHDDLNGAVFRAFMERSSRRGWKVGKKDGKRVDTKIQFRIPLHLIRGVC